MKNILQYIHETNVVIQNYIQTGKMKLEKTMNKCSHLYMNLFPRLKCEWFVLSSNEIKIQRWRLINHREFTYESNSHLMAKKEIECVI